jgi:hypothetical protein
MNATRAGLADCFPLLQQMKLNVGGFSIAVICSYHMMKLDSVLAFRCTTDAIHHDPRRSHGWRSPELTLSRGAITPRVVSCEESPSPRSSKCTPYPDAARSARESRTCGGCQQRIDLPRGDVCGGCPLPRRRHLGLTVQKWGTAATPSNRRGLTVDWIASTLFSRCKVNERHASRTR